VPDAALLPFAPHWLVDAVVLFTVTEAIVLVWLHRRHGRGVPPGEFLANMASGLSLMFALRAALTDAGPWLVALGLVAAGVLHGVDLWRRWR
jgi:hypothetical protein